MEPSPRHEEFSSFPKTINSLSIKDVRHRIKKVKIPGPKEIQKKNERKVPGNAWLILWRETDGREDVNML